MTKKHNKAIIFDLGAVMVEWNPSSIVQNYTDDIVLQQNIIQQLFEHSLWQHFDQGKINEQQLIQQVSIELSFSLEQTQQLMQQAKLSIVAKTETVNLLKLAKKMGLMTLSLSNLSHEWLDYLSKKHDFFALFDHLVISAQEGICKPNKAIYLRMIERYHLNPENCLFIDDRKENTQAASELGMQCITFNDNPAQLDAITRFITD